MLSVTSTVGRSLDKRISKKLSSCGRYECRAKSTSRNAVRHLSLVVIRLPCHPSGWCPRATFRWSGYEGGNPGLKKTIRWQLHRGIPSLSMPCNCGSKAHYAVAENSPCRLKQFGCLMLHFAKSHNVSGIFAHGMPRFNCCY